MDLEKRVWIAAVLSATLLIGYSQWMRKSFPQVEQHLIAPQSVEGKHIAKPMAGPQEEQIVLESSHLRLAIGASSAMVHSATLKDYTQKKTGVALQFGRIVPILSVRSGDEEALWNLVANTGPAASWTRVLPSGIRQVLTIELDSQQPVFVVRVESSNQGANPQRLPISFLASWERSDELSQRTNPLESVLHVEKHRGWQRDHLRYREGGSMLFEVPRGTKMLTLAERYFCLVLKSDSLATAQVTPTIPHAISTNLSFQAIINPGNVSSSAVKVYAGPRDFFHLRDAGFEEAFPLGILSKIGLILMAILKWIASAVHNYGVALILLSASITFMLSPFTIISFKSMKKLQTLQPLMEQIKQKHEKDSQRANKEMMALFKEHRVSPLSGCLPMLLPLPIFFALWSSVTHFVGLRGAEFLWIKDLSLPDKFAKMPFGFELNLLPVLMCIAMYFQSRLSQQAAAQSAKNPFSGPMMSVIFLLMFYQVPSGLVLYWLTNSLVSIFWYRVAVS